MLHVESVSQIDKEKRLVTIITSHKYFVSNLIEMNDSSDTDSDDDQTKIIFDDLYITDCFRDNGREDALIHVMKIRSPVQNYHHYHRFMIYGLWMLNSGRWTLDARLWTLDSAPWLPHLGSQALCTYHCCRLVQNKIRTQFLILLILQRVQVKCYVIKEYRNKILL